MRRYRRKKISVYQHTKTTAISCCRFYFFPNCACKKQTIIKPEAKTEYRLLRKWVFLRVKNNFIHLIKGIFGTYRHK